MMLAHAGVLPQGRDKLEFRIPHAPWPST
jgi:hypothetical protein